MKTKMTICFFLLTMSFMVHAKSNDSFTLAYINKDSVINLLPQTILFNEDFLSLQNEYQGELDIMVKQYNRKVKQYLSIDQSSNPTIRDARQAEISSIEIRIDKYKESYLAELNGFRERYVKKVEAEFNAAVKTVAAKYKVNMVFDQATPIYVDENCIDISKDVLNILMK